MGKWERELIEISKYAGMREDLIQAGGGNSSVKIDGNRMAIKSSGVQMADIREDYGYSIVNYQGIAERMGRLVHEDVIPDDGELLEKFLITGKRPSIETFLHAITGKVTLHTHSVAASILAARNEGMYTLKELFPDALLVGYSTPGLHLAKSYYQAYLDGQLTGDQIQIIFLENHGMLVSGGTAAEVIQLTEEVNLKIENVIGLDNSAYHQAYEVYKQLNSLGVFSDKLVVKVENKEVLDIYHKRGNSMWDFQTTPDCVVFCGRHSLVYSSDCQKESIQNFLDIYGEPIIIEYGENLFIRADSVKKAKEIESVFALSAKIVLLNENYGVKLLSAEEQKFLLGWDAEKIRQKA